MPVLAGRINKKANTPGPPALYEPSNGHAGVRIIAIVPRVIHEDAHAIGLRGPHGEPVGDIGVIPRLIDQNAHAVIMTAAL